MANRKPMKFNTNPLTGCMTCSTHKLNQDGYLRKVWADSVEMFHRYIYRIHNALMFIPEGYEINHLCNNRGCCNPLHLEMIPREEHLILTNNNRYRDRKRLAYVYWKNNPGITGRTLGEYFDVSFSIACRWIREWKETH